MAETADDETPTGGNGKPAYGPGSAFHGKKERSGARVGNRSAMRHGLRAGKLPADCAYIEVQLNGLRRLLEDAVLAARGAVTLVDAANIQTAIRWERHGALALRWMRVSGDKLKPTEQLAFSREIARASTERDKALAALKLDRDTADDVIARLYAKPALVLPAPPDEAKGDDDGPT